jgi:L-arabinose isomerase
MLKHLVNPKPRVALLGTYIDLYNTALPGHREKMTAFAMEIAAAMAPIAEVLSLDIRTTPADVKSFVADAKTAGADALVVLSLGYTNSLTAADALISTPLPVIFFNTQILEEVTRDYKYQDLCDNHGMQGIQDLAAVLVRNGRRFGIVTGLVTQPETMDALRDQLAAARALGQLRHSRIGSLTPPMDGMGDAQVDPNELDRAFGIRHLAISPGELVEGARDATEAEVDACIAFDRLHFRIDPALTDADHRRSARLEVGLRRIADGRELAGLVFAFDELIAFPGIDTQPFLGISKLMADGIGYGGEGDVLTAASGIIARCLCDEVNFTEMYTMDFRNNAVIDTHMAEGNWRMHRRDQMPRLVRREFHLAKCEPFASLAFSLEPGPVTLFNLTFDAARRFHFITLECEVDDFPDLESFSIPNFRLRFRRKLAEVLDEYSLLGGTHHLSLVYGGRTRRFADLARHLGVAHTGIRND